MLANNVLIVFGLLIPFCFFWHMNGMKIQHDDLPLIPSQHIQTKTYPFHCTVKVSFSIDSFFNLIVDNFGLRYGNKERSIIIR